MKKLKNIHSFKLIVPIILLGMSTGAVTGAMVSLYKFFAKHAIYVSEKMYHFFGENLWAFCIILPALFGFAILLSFIYKKMPTLKGGGICEAMGLVSGIFTFKWLRSLIGTVTLSLANFTLGVPLGNEGPSVQIGASIGKASTLILGKKGGVWSRYSIASGACSGFAAATGAPMTGIVFALEEMHRRLSPMIIVISLVSVAACRAVTELICPLLGISVELFPALSLPSLSVSELWLPLAIGLVMGFFSVGFLLAFKCINGFMDETLEKVKPAYKIFAVLALTVVFGLVSHSFISTGHHLTEELLKPQGFALLLIALLLMRTVLTLSANSAGLTGGMFLPTLAISALASALTAHGFMSLGIVNEGYYTLIVVLGVVSGMAGIMNMPFTAILFALEVLSCSGNLLPIMVVSGVSFAVVELFHCKSINELALEKRVEKERTGKKAVSVERDVVIQKGSFAVGKEIKDIFWPANLLVLSVLHPKEGQNNGSFLGEGDTLHVRYTTCNEKATNEELFAIVGKEGE